MKYLSTIFTIAKKDLKTYFTSPIAFILIGGFSFVMGFMFFSILRIYIAQSAQFGAFGGGGKGPNLTDSLIRPLFGNMNVIFLFLVPFITMRLIAEERKNNTIELLLTAPVTIGQMVLGKFFSALGFMLVLIAVTAPYPLALAITASPDWAVLGLAYLGTICMVSVYLSVGILCSAFTENQIVAGFLTFAIMLFLWVIKWMSYSNGAGGIMTDVFSYLSIVDHFEDFSKGVFNTKDLVFYFSATGLALFFTYKHLESHTWRA